MLDMKNERWLMEKYNALSDAERGEYALISLKIKRFRVFNRLYNRELGDILIEKVYEALQEWLQPGEYAAQIHLNYFNLLVRLSKNYEEIFQYVMRLNQQIRDMPDERFHGKVFCGFGIYHLTREPVNFYIAQYNADICRSECAERDFKNSHFDVYGQSYHDPVLRDYDLEQIIQPALQRGDLQLYLQPKVDLRTGEVTRAEALIRWIDPERGMIPVPDFLPMLESTGLIDSVDLHTFEVVCRTINRWLRMYNKKIQISVNLSHCMFNYRYYFDDYRKIHEKYRTPKECIEFELLESIVLNQVERLRQVVDELHNYGFTCSLDDFGSGFSSYSVLSHADLSMLKIDSSLFQNESNPREKVLIRHIVQSAHELGIMVVAEGVETPRYVDYLRQLGCDFLQGFVFYRPMPVEEFEERFVRGNEKVRFS